MFRNMTLISKTYATFAVLFLSLPGCTNGQGPTPTDAKAIAFRHGSNGSDAKNADVVSPDATDTASNNEPDCEGEASTLHRRFQSTIDAFTLPQGRLTSEDAVTKVAETVASLDQMVHDMQRLASKQMKSAAMQARLGEMALDLNGVLGILERNNNLSAISSHANFTSQGDLQQLARSAFEQALKLDTQSAVSHDGLAKLKFAATGAFADMEVARHLILSIVNDPESPRSIPLLIAVLVNSRIVQQDTRNYLFIQQTLGRTRGEAREELKRGHEFVKNELREAMRLSERMALYGRIDRETQAEIKQLSELHALLQGVIDPNTISLVRP